MATDKIPSKKRYMKLTFSEPEFNRIVKIANAWGISPTKLVTHVVISAFVLHIKIEDTFETIKEKKYEGGS